MILTMKEHLDALKEAELRTFQWYLIHEVKVGWPSIPWSQVEKVTRETTVDIMVQAYGEDGAVEVMVTILKLMKRNDQASRLSQAKQSSKVGLHLLESRSSTVRDTDRIISVYNISNSTVNISGTVILDSSDHQICQNCGTKVERAQNALPNPELLPQAGIDLTNHVENLQVKVLEKGLSSLKPAPVILIPEIECHFEPSLWPYSKEEEEEEDILAILEDYQCPEAPVILLPEMDCLFESSLWPTSKEEEEDIQFRAELLALS